MTCSRTSAVGRCHRGRPTRRRRQLRLLCRHGTRVIAGAFSDRQQHATGRNRIASASEIARAIIGTFSCTICQPRFATAIALMAHASPMHRYDYRPGITGSGRDAGLRWRRWGSMCELNPRESIRRCMYVRVRATIGRTISRRSRRSKTQSSTKLHVRGFTVHPSSGVAQPGTFAGLIEKIPYLKDLGVTAVELLPDPRIRRIRLSVFTNPYTGEKLRNFWGYNSIAFAAPKAAYAAQRPRSRAGRRVPRHGQAPFTPPASKSSSTSSSITPAKATTAAEPIPFAASTTTSITCSMPDGNYLNFSGCGNTVNCNHPVVRRSAHDLPALLGRRHARRWPALRPGVGLRPRSHTATCWSIRRSSRSSSRTACWPTPS